jgi:phosphatidyl-myo-inositol dimannoside synthase
MGAETLRDSGNRIVALFPALLGLGGVQEAGRLTAAALAQIASNRNWGVDFLSLNDPPGVHNLPSNGTDIPFRGFGRAKARFAVAAIAGARRRARFVFAAHPNLALVAAQMKLSQRRLKMAVISHGVEVWLPLATVRRKAFLTADIFMAPSRYTVEQIINVQGAARSKTRLVPWPLDPDFLQMAAKPEIWPAPSDFPNGLVVMAAARLAKDERYKGIDHLINAVGRLASTIPSLHLIVVGSGDDLPRHQEMVRKRGLSERVRFYSGLTRAEIAGCYARCDVFALPSTGEGFGFVFVEAMAFAKPVIGAAAGGVTDIIEHGHNGLLVAPGDLRQLVEALQRLLANESFRRELGEKGSEMISSKFQFDNFRLRLEGIFSEK